MELQRRKARGLINPGMELPGNDEISTEMQINTITSGVYSVEQEQKQNRMKYCFITCVKLTMHVLLVMCNCSMFLSVQSPLHCSLLCCRSLTTFSRMQQMGILMAGPLEKVCLSLHSHVIFLLWRPDCICTLLFLLQQNSNSKTKSWYSFTKRNDLNLVTVTK